MEHHTPDVSAVCKWHETNLRDEASKSLESIWANALWLFVENSENYGLLL